MTSTGGTALDFDHGTVDGSAVPVDVPLPIFLKLKGGQDGRPGAIPRPTGKAVIAGTPGTIAFRDIPPRRTSTQSPDDAIDDTAMIDKGVPTFGVCREKRFQSAPLLFGEVSSSHPPTLPLSVVQTLGSAIGQGALPLIAVLTLNASTF